MSHLIGCCKHGRNLANCIECSPDARRTRGGMKLKNPEYHRASDREIRDARSRLTEQLARQAGISEFGIDTFRVDDPDSRCLVDKRLVGQLLCLVNRLEDDTAAFKEAIEVLAAARRRLEGGWNGESRNVRSSEA